MHSKTDICLLGGNLAHCTCIVCDRHSAFLHLLQKYHLTCNCTAIHVALLPSRRLISATLSPGGRGGEAGVREGPWGQRQLPSLLLTTTCLCSISSLYSLVNACRHLTAINRPETGTNPSSSSPSDPIQDQGEGVELTRGQGGGAERTDPVAIPGQVAVAGVDACMPTLPPAFAA